MEIKTKVFRVPQSVKHFRREMLEDCIVLLTNELPETLPLYEDKTATMQLKVQASENLCELVELAASHYKVSQGAIVTAAILRVKESPMYFEAPTE